jgi:glycosyltransferase involved in cell wall biosynthesis
VVRDRVNGFLVPVKESVALADRIAELLADRELRQRMGALGRDFAVRELSIERCVERTFALYRKVGLGVQTSGPAVELTH